MDGIRKVSEVRFKLWFVTQNFSNCVDYSSTISSWLVLTLKKIESFLSVRRLNVCKAKSFHCYDNEQRRNEKLFYSIKKDWEKGLIVQYNVSNWMTVLNEWEIQADQTGLNLIKLLGAYLSA